MIDQQRVDVMRTGTFAYILMMLSVLPIACGPVVTLEEFPSLADGLILHPERDCEQLAEDFGLPAFEGVSNPADIGLTYLESRVPVGDARTLRTWFIPAQGTEQGVILLAYGAVGDMNCYLWIALNLVQRGWSVAMYDFAGFGGSSGTAGLDTLIDDGAAALDWTLSVSNADQIVLMGISIGTLPTLASAAARRERVAAVIIDGPISLDVEVAQFPVLLGPRPTDFADQFASELRIELQIPQITAPQLVFAYGRDAFATSAVADQIFPQSAGPVAIALYPELEHARGPYFAPESFFPTVQEFLRPVARDPESLPVGIDLGSPFDFTLPE